jgi:hypothetical protein
MAMIVDKAGGDDLAADIDHLVGGAGQLAQLGDLAVLDGDVAVKPGHSRTVDDAPVLDQEIIRHRFPPVRKRGSPRCWGKL